MLKNFLEYLPETQTGWITSNLYYKNGLGVHSAAIFPGKCFRTAVLLTSRTGTAEGAHQSKEEFAI